MKKNDLVDVSKGRIRFEDNSKRVWIVPLSTFSMRMDIINDDEGEYRHFFYDNAREIEVDGGTYLEASELLF